jgi:hypothetical protein
MARPVVANRFEAARLPLGTVFGAEANPLRAPPRDPSSIAGAGRRVRRLGRSNDPRVVMGNLTENMP